jgi:hypothetical protein
MGNGVKRPGREADNSLPTSVEVDLYIHSPIRLHGVIVVQKTLRKLLLPPASAGFSLDLMEATFSSETSDFLQIAQFSMKS